jgi:hypothetical protein
LHCQSRDQQRAENSERCLLHARLHWLDIRPRHPCLAVRVLMRQNLASSVLPSMIRHARSTCGPSHISRSLDGGNHPRGRIETRSRSGGSPLLIATQAAPVRPFRA